MKCLRETNYQREKGRNDNWIGVEWVFLTWHIKERKNMPWDITFLGKEVWMLDREEYEFEIQMV